MEKSGLITADLEVLRNHYALTLKEWSRRFQSHRKHFVATKSEEFCRMWEFYLVVCQTGFEVGDLIVHHWQLSKRNLSVPVTRDYLYPAGPAVSENILRAPARVNRRHSHS